MTGPVDLAVVDNDRMLLEGVGRWFGERAELRLVATATSVDELLAHPARPAVTLLDLLLGNGSEPQDNVRRLVAAGHRVLVVSVSNRAEHIVTAFAAGALGYLTKEHELAELVDAVRELSAGAVSCSPELAMACLHDRRPDRPTLTDRERAVLTAHGCGLRPAAVATQLGLTRADITACLAQLAARYRAARVAAAHPRLPGLSALTARERQIATLVTAGLTNKQIARRLGVTAKTVEKHLTNTMAKLGAPCRAAVAGQIARSLTGP